MTFLGESCLGHLHLFYGGSDVYEQKPKQRMLAYARQQWQEEFVAFQINDSERGVRRFGAAACWDEVACVVERIPPLRRHLYELIRSTRPCKPYIDIDLNDKQYTEAEVVMALNRIIPTVFDVVYGVRVTEHDCVWTSSSRPSKPVSLHLTVTTQPQIVFETNMEGRANSAYSFARALKLALFEDGKAWLAEAVDETVYSSDREMRTVHSTKYGIDSPLRPLGKSRHVADYFITWIRGECRALQHAAVMRPRKVREEEEYSVPSSWAEGKGTFQSYMKPYSNEWLYGILDAIDDSYWQDRTSWLRIAAAMKSLGMSYDDFDRLSLVHGGSTYGGTMELWNSLEARSHNSPSLATLCHLARDSKPDQYDAVSSLPETDPRAMIVNEHVRRVMPQWKTTRFVKMASEDIGRMVIAYGIGCKTVKCRPYVMINLLTGDAFLRCKTCRSRYRRTDGSIRHFGVRPRKALCLSLSELE